MMAIRYILNHNGRITANTDDLRRAVKEMDAPMDRTNKRKTGGEVELLPLPKTWRIAQHGADFIEVHTAEQMEAYTRANVDRALAESRKQLSDTAQALANQTELVKHYKARAERLAEALRIAYRHIDITGLRVSHCKDAAALDAALSLEPTP